MRFAFEGLMILTLLGVFGMLVVFPVVKIVKQLLPAKKVDPVKQAQERLILAQAEIEAMRLNRQAEYLYDALYTEALDESTETKKESSK